MFSVLWVEDEANRGLKYLTKICISEGYVFDLAQTISEALDFLKQREYDVIVIDLLLSAGEDFPTGDELPGRDFLEKLIGGEIRGINNKIFPITNLKVLTNFGNDQVTIDLLKGYLNNFISKEGINPEKFKQLIDTYLI